MSIYKVSQRRVAELAWWFEVWRVAANRSGRMALSLITDPRGNPMRRLPWRTPADWKKRRDSAMVKMVAAKQRFIRDALKGYADE